MCDSVGLDFLAIYLCLRSVLFEFLQPVGLILVPVHPHPHHKGLPRYARRGVTCHVKLLFKFIGLRVELRGVT